MFRTRTHSKEVAEALGKAAKGLKATDEPDEPDLSLVSLEALVKEIESRCWKANLSLSETE